MDFRALTFYFFAAVMVFAALRVITARNPVHSALFLVLAFFTAAGLWMLLEAEFLAIALVLVYVGAVMVLFLFVVMMLDINLDRLREGYWDYLVPGLIVAGAMVAEMAWCSAAAISTSRACPSRLRMTLATAIRGSWAGSFTPITFIRLKSRRSSCWSPSWRPSR